ncbi:MULTISPECIES: sigma-70 family RNA polymerase sigma factor [unclassified Thermotoga]|uniref:sigma-70 family RNA polymerase sigma factor n=1 Tax=unclassified Thermotoga TaxID=2631113 RepID=UPI000280EA62|nr:MULTISPECIES: sigma-70 family RNA polymerase sigma factor [unclassified Thermotoga]AIY85951.1 RNA polymerase factor sigma-70 [Thermotoga sp. 2812B]EJX26764.1 RNA polymerase factor sigma-70 [Thermotoga sp. EMP]
MLKYRLRSKRVEELVEYAQAGFKEAIDLIVEKYYPMVVKIASQYFASWAEHEDIVQNGLVGLIKAIFYYDRTKSSFTSFAWRSVDSEIKSFLTYLNRKKNRMLSDAVNVDGMEKEEDDAPFEVPDSETDVARSAFSGIILETVLELLNEKEKEIFLKWLDGYSYSEIAKELGVNTKKVDNTVQKVKRMISGLG